MLPGFRFLFAAILLSMSTLVFGLGAAALLRAAHEEVASTPAWRVTREPVFAQQAEPAPPTLALLRVEPTAEKPAEQVAPTEAPAEQVPEASPPAETEKLTALKPDEAAPPETATPEAAKAETPPSETAPAAQVQSSDQAAAPAPADEVEFAAVADTPPASEAAAAPPEPAPATAEQQATSEISPAAMKVATLGGPAVTIEETASANAAGAKPDPGAAKKRARAERARLRQRAAQRAGRVVAQQRLDPFGLPTVTPATR
jgi:hypothetical protein